jgi:hypothetical protein
METVDSTAGESVEDEMQINETGQEKELAPDNMSKRGTSPQGRLQVLKYDVVDYSQVLTASPS